MKGELCVIQNEDCIPMIHIEAGEFDDRYCECFIPIEFSMNLPFEAHHWPKFETRTL